MFMLGGDICWIMKYQCVAPPHGHAINRLLPERSIMAELEERVEGSYIIIGILLIPENIIINFGVVEAVTYISVTLTWYPRDKGCKFRIAGNIRKGLVVKGSD